MSRSTGVRRGSGTHAQLPVHRVAMSGPDPLPMDTFGILIGGWFLTSGLFALLLARVCRSDERPAGQAPDRPPAAHERAPWARDGDAASGQGGTSLGNGERGAGGDGPRLVRVA